jgi:flavin reductase (DIM6/NTAB) family NADH-FMN oxidoreductase RutF
MNDGDLRLNFIEGMSRAATFVSVITTDGTAGRFGVTVSSMTSVSADGAGPSLLVCVQSRSQTAPAILQNRRFAAILLHENQQDVANLFAGRQGVEMADRFDKLDWKAGRNGSPLISGATAGFECELKTAMLWETHYIIVGEVTNVTLSDQPEALLYGARGYRRAVEFN